MEVICTLGIWNTSVPQPAEWHRWCRESVEGDPAKVQLLEECLADARKAHYVAVMVFGGEDLPDYFVQVVSGDTATDVLCDAIAKVEKAAQQGKLGGYDMMYVDFEDWCHDLKLMEEARSDIDRIVESSGAGVTVQETLH